MLQPQHLSKTFEKVLKKNNLEDVALSVNLTDFDEYS